MVFIKGVSKVVDLVPNNPRTPALCRVESLQRENQLSIAQLTTRAAPRDKQSPPPASSEQGAGHPWFTPAASLCDRDRETEALIVT